MAINLSRAQRGLNLPTTGATLQDVGPGYYAKESGGPASEAPVPFLSLQERVLNANKTTSATTPGPGNYRSPPPTLSDHCPTSLLSKVRRIGPSSPGSSIYMSSTIEGNPGPGTYPKAIHKDLGKQQQKPLVLPTKPVLQDFEKSTPSMPLMKIRPGQRSENESDNDVANLIMRHTGEGGDTAGPGEYDPEGGYTAVSRNCPTCRFQGSTSARRSYFTPPSEAPPGPGTYELPHPFGDPKTGEDEDEEFTANTYQFASHSLLAYQVETQPNKTTPGPGEYDIVGGIDKKVLLARRRTVARGDETQFGSMTERSSLLVREGRTPYTDPYNLHHVPGPGHYPASSFVSDDKKKQEKEKLLANSRRKKIHGVHHPTIVMALAEAQGPLQAFNSTDDRPCNKQTPTQGPAPWQYNRDMARGQSMGAELRERAKVGRRGAFGSCADRFYGSPLDGKNGLPDPFASSDGFGAGGSSPGGEMRSAFQSSTPRFRPAAGPREERVVKVGASEGPAPGQYETTKEPSYRSPYRAPRTEHLSFGSARTRFDPGHDREDVFFEHMRGSKNPGPGDYESQKPHRKAVGIILSKAAPKAIPVGCTTEVVGPGSYGDVETHMLKKTFNVSTQAPAT
eukprot:CAMPEP_0206430188 /NCGR_PEP_ID=MMETSP0324_2-20121206/6677_1 /ASSEMBLY_ACC=CAM_ASM_000836 /TAXON_ID=2866 /ORGANISM="Crypthecodinium cohnii, Strain Seligo" /LENGTH=621 /DNA_ID=CAMNT_0053895991 /DNA_START=7 /DNA_END=1869 /DNA_ORIENTATION=+